MSKIIRQQQPVPASLITLRWQALISILLVLHLLSIGLSYATNWRRSSIEDNAIVWIQPYLIGFNWYQEMLPIEWISENNRPGSIQLSVEYADAQDQWIPIFESEKATMSRGKNDRLLHLLSELASGGDSQGLTLVLKSIVLHLEAGRKAKMPLVSKIRLAKFSDPTVFSDSDNRADVVLYEASLARFASGEFGFIPKVESHRSVRAQEAVRGNP